MARLPERLAATALGTVLAAFLAVAPPASAQEAQGISLSGSVKKPQPVDASGLAALPRHGTLAKIPGAARYRGTFEIEGVALKDLLEKAEVAKSTSDNFDRPLDLAVVVTPSDGYRSLYSGGEILLSRLPENVVLVETEDGRPLLRKSGRLKAVARGDFFVDRSVRSVAEIRCVNVP